MKLADRPRYVMWAEGLALAIVIVPFAVGAALDLPESGARADEPAAGWDFVASIASVNLLVTVGFLSGLATMGLSTLVAGTINFVVLGSQISELVDQIGWIDVFVGLFLYAPFELTGLWLAAAAGLLSLTALISSVAGSHVSVRQVLLRFARYAVLATALIVVGAILEGQVALRLTDVSAPLELG